MREGKRRKENLNVVKKAERPKEGAKGTGGRHLWV